MARRLTRTQIAHTVARLMQDGETANLAQEIAAYLMSEHRLRDLDSIMRDAARIRYEKYGILEATATTARPLTAEAKRDIKEYLASKQVILNEDQNPAVVGGLRLEALDKQLDVSIKGRLNRLKQLVSEA